RPHQMWRDQPDEADGAGHRDRATDAERDARYHPKPEAVDVDAKALRRLLAKAERTESIALAEQDDRARDNERQRQHDMTEAAILERTEQPERNLERHKRIARKIHHQR